MSTELEKQQTAAATGREDVARVSVFVPEADIYETEKEIKVFANLPGVTEKGLDIRVEKNILTIAGSMDPVDTAGFTVLLPEYVTGRFERQFILTNEVDTTRIEATLTDGVLSLVLPKAEKALPKKITVKTA